MNKPIFHPGDYIKDLLEDLKITQHELANRLDVTDKELSKVINKKQSLSTSLAIKLAEMLNTSAEVWLNIQNKYDIDNAKLGEYQRLLKEKAILDDLDYKFFVSEGVVEYQRSWQEKIKQLHQGLQVSNLENLKEEEMLSFTKTASIRQPKNTIVARNAWMSIGFNKAKEITVNAFNKKALNSRLKKFKTLTKIEFYKSLKQLTKELAEVGVRLIFMDALKNANINGATKWLNDNTVMVLVNNYGKYHDIFWFAFFHEMAHVLSGQKRRLLTSVNSVIEEEANQYARNILIDKSEYKELIKQTVINKQVIIDFAVKQDIHPGIVVGRLQKDEIIDHKDYNELRMKI